MVNLVNLPQINQKNYQVNNFTIWLNKFIIG